MDFLAQEPTPEPGASEALGRTYLLCVPTFWIGPYLYFAGLPGTATLLVAVPLLTLYCLLALRQKITFYADRLRIKPMATTPLIAPYSAIKQARMTANTLTVETHSGKKIAISTLWSSKASRNRVAAQFALHNIDFIQ